MRNIILASQSLQRKMMMETLGLNFTVIPSELDEKKVDHSDLKIRAQQIALAKAQIVLEKYPDSIVIAADTYGQYHGQAFEKPRDTIEAKLMLSKLSGQWFTALTGFAYLDSLQSIEVSTVVEIQAQFRKLVPVEIDYYVEHNPVTTWSIGFSPAYAAGAALIAKVNGSLTAFSHGLPMELVVSCLEKSHVFN